MLAEHVFRLDGDVAIVTGSAAGIGRAIALTFAQCGAAVVVTDLNKEGAEAVARAITETGGKAIGLECDVTQEAHLTAVIDQTIRAFGKISILVNNAGGGGPKPFDMPMRDFRWAFELNVFSLFRLTQLAVPHMEKAGEGHARGRTGEEADDRASGHRHALRFSHPLSG